MNPNHKPPGRGGGQFASGGSGSANDVLMPRARGKALLQTTSWRELAAGHIAPVDLYHGLPGRSGIGKLAVTNHGGGLYTVAIQIREKEIHGAPVIPLATRKPADMALDAARRGRDGQQELTGHDLLKQYVKLVVVPHAKQGVEPYPGAKQDFSSHYRDAFGSDVERDEFGYRL